MFSLPSLWNLIISTIVFLIAAWYIHRYLEDQGIPKGATRSIGVFLLASLISWGAGEIVDWGESKITGTQPAPVSSDLNQMLKEVDH